MQFEMIFVELYLKKKFMNTLVALGTKLDQQVSHSRQCSTTGITKATVYTILSVGWCM